MACCYTWCGHLNVHCSFSDPSVSCKSRNKNTTKNVSIACGCLKLATWKRKATFLHYINNKQNVMPVIIQTSWAVYSANNRLIYLEPPSTDIPKQWGMSRYQFLWDIMLYHPVMQCHILEEWTHLPHQCVNHPPHPLKKIKMDEC
jgi:hypothetical protein